MKHRFISSLRIPVIAGMLAFAGASQVQAVSTSLVVSQVYGGGGLGGATYLNDYIEICNIGSTTIDFAVTNYSVQYGSATGSTYSKVTDLTTGQLPPGRYWLIQCASGGAVGATLPTPNSTGTTNMSNTDGKVLVVSGTTLLTGTCPSGVTLIDMVGYGSAANCAETTITQTPSPSLSVSRNNETDNNSLDFYAALPRPRNLAYIPPIDGRSTDATVTVNAAGGADYTSLWTAAQDINQLIFGIKANWTIEIASNLTESLDVPMANTIAAGKSITIKPKAGANPVVTFAFTTAAASLNAHLLIGVNSRNNSNDANVKNMHDLVIDGSNNGTSSRNLTWRNTAAAGSNYTSFVLRVVGNSDNVTIKNCIIENVSAGTANDQVALEFASRKATVGNFVPTNGKVQNCLVNSTSAPRGYGIRTAASGTPTAGTGQTGMEVSRNLITVSHRAIEFGESAGGTITSNTLRVLSTAPDRDNYAINHNGSRSTNFWTALIAGNTIDRLETANITSGNFGISGMNLSGASATSFDTTYTVVNNMITGFNFTGTPPPGLDMRYRGIASTSVAASFKIYNNSINMPAFANVNATTQCLGIGFVPSTPPLGIYDVRNNIISVGQDSGSAVNIATSTATVSLDYNNWHASGNALVGRVATTTYTTLLSWQGGTGYDPNSTDLNPTVPNLPATGTWASVFDLHFTADPGVSFRGINIAAVPNDIDGDVRPALPTKGIDDDPFGSPVGTDAEDWQLFQ